MPGVAASARVSVEVPGHHFSRHSSRFGQFGSSVEVKRPAKERFAEGGFAGKGTPAEKDRPAEEDTLAEENTLAEKGTPAEKGVSAVGTSEVGKTAAAETDMPVLEGSHVGGKWAFVLLEKAFGCQYEQVWE